ncbi:MAG: DUF3592 domain-containing protein [Desulfobacterales bacterium]|nr:MAG: DUF3592 domain-containing protein [Desulfobacterales bacterium]
MPQSNTTTSFGSMFWTIWSKIWWLVGIAFIAGVLYLAFTNLRLLVQLFSFLFIVSGIGGLMYGARTRRLQQQSLSWFPVSGEILTANLEKETHRSHAGSLPSTITTYMPRVEYTYDYQGKTYRSRRIIVASINWPLQEAEEALARYPVGSTPTVWVNPNRPQLAVLEPGLVGKTTKYLVIFIIGAVFLCAGIIGWFIGPLFVR